MPSLRWVRDWCSGWVAGDPNESLRLSRDAMRGGLAEWMLSAKASRTLTEAQVTQAIILWAPYRAVVVGPART